MSPIGFYGTPLHVLTNKKVANKKECFKEQIKTGVKDSFKATAAVAGITGASAGVTALVDKVKPSALDGIRNTYREFIKNLPLDELTPSAKNLINSFNKIPAPLKVALAVGTFATVLTSSILSRNSIGKMGGIEGKYEVNNK